MWRSGAGPPETAPAPPARSGSPPPHCQEGGGQYRSGSTLTGHRQTARLPRNGGVRLPSGVHPAAVTGWGQGQSLGPSRWRRIPPCWFGCQGNQWQRTYNRFIYPCKFDTSLKTDTVPKLPCSVEFPDSNPTLTIHPEQRHCGNQINSRYHGCPFPRAGARPSLTTS